MATQHLLKAHKACKDYLKARQQFIEIAHRKELKYYLGGNDNIIGRIGEFYAILYLKNQGYSVTKPENDKSNPGFDLHAQKDKTTCRVQVKVITCENKIGRTTRIQRGKYDMFIGFEFDEQYEVKKMGCFTHEEYATFLNQNPSRSQNPYFSRSMLKDRGLFSHIGTLIYKNEMSFIPNT